MLKFVVVVLAVATCQHAQGQFRGINPRLLGANQNTVEERATITCVGHNYGANGDDYLTVTFEAVSTPSTNPWGAFGVFGGTGAAEVTGIIRVMSRNIDGRYHMVVTRRARDDAQCTVDGEGPIVLRQNNAARFSNWRIGGVTSTTDRPNGIITEFDIIPGQVQQTEVTQNSLPYTNLRDFAGRGIALCQIVVPISETVNMGWGRTEAINTGATCEGEIPLCCKLGHDNMEAFV